MTPSSQLAVLLSKSALLFSHGTVFFSHNKSAAASASAENQPAKHGVNLLHCPNQVSGENNYFPTLECSHNWIIKLI